MNSRAGLRGPSRCVHLRPPRCRPNDLSSGSLIRLRRTLSSLGHLRPGSWFLRRFGFRSIRCMGATPMTRAMLDVLALLLQAWEDKTDLHGWSIMKSVHRSGPVVYGVLDRLEDAGWISA